jgi:hypothetical protein
VATSRNGAILRYHLRDAYAKSGCTRVPDTHIRRSRSLARSPPSAGEDANPPGGQRHRRTGSSAARQTLRRAPSVIRSHAQIAATRHAKRAARLWQAPSPICQRPSARRITSPRTASCTEKTQKAPTPVADYGATGAAARAWRRRTPSRHEEGRGAIARKPRRRRDPQALRRRSGGLWVSRAGWPVRP